MVFTQTLTGQTTVFTPPADCSASWTYEASFYNSVSGGLLLQNLLPGQLADGCFPSGFDAYGRAPSSIQVYSPGACPGGYATPGAFNNAGTTTAICCPSSFSYYSTYSSINYFGSSSVLYQGCVSTFRGTTTVSARSGNTNLQQTVVSGPLTMWGQPVIVQYQQKDLSLFTTASSTTSSSTSRSSGTSTPTSTSTSTPTNNASNNTNVSSGPSGGLQTWAKAVIAVAVILGVFIIVGLAGFLIRRHRRKRAAAPPSQTNAGPYGYTQGQPAIPQASMVNKSNEVYEFYSGNPADGRQEIAGKPLPKLSPSEMEGSSSANGSAHGAGHGSGYNPAGTTNAVGGTGSWIQQPSRNSRPIELE